MSRFGPSDIRNVVLVGQGGSGKTIVTERLVFHAGASQRVGRVEDGTTVSDFLDEEIKRHISTSIGLCEFDYKGTRFNLLDTPGYADFMTEAQEAVRVADTALLTINASAGIEVQTPRFWSLCESQHVPVAFVINKLDLDNVDVDGLVASLQSAFGNKVVPLVRGCLVRWVCQCVDGKFAQLRGGQRGSGLDRCRPRFHAVRVRGSAPCAHRGSRRVG